MTIEGFRERVRAYCEAVSKQLGAMGTRIVRMDAKGDVFSEYECDQLKGRERAKTIELAGVIFALLMTAVFIYGGSTAPHSTLMWIGTGALGFCALISGKEWLLHKKAQEEERKEFKQGYRDPQAAAILDGPDAHYTAHDVVEEVIATCKDYFERFFPKEESNILIGHG